jgi:hypothetical protein
MWWLFWNVNTGRATVINQKRGLWQDWRLARCSSTVLVNENVSCTPWERVTYTYFLKQLELCFFSRETVHIPMSALSYLHQRSSITCLMNPFHFLLPYFYKISFKIIYLYLCLSSGLFPLDFPTQMLNAFLISSIRTTCPAHLILLDLNRYLVKSIKYEGTKNILSYHG